MVEGMSCATPRVPASGRARGRALFSISDQAVSSLGNFVLISLVARHASTHDFGAFGLAFTAYTFTMGVSRSLITEPLIVKFSARAIRETRRAARAALGASLAFSTAVAVLLLLASLILPDNIRLTFCVLALALPCLLLQDASRYVAVVQRRPDVALSNDLLWSILTVLGLGLLILEGIRSVPVMIAFWAVASLAGALLNCVWVQSYPDLRSPSLWITHNWGLGRPFLLQFLVESGVLALIMFAIAGLAGLAAAAALRVAATIFGPVTTLFTGVQLFIVPEMARHLRTSPIRSFSGMVAACGGILAIAAIAWTFIILILPGDLGTLFFGASWSHGKAIILPYGAYVVAAALVVAPASALRAMGQAGAGLRIALTQLPAVILAPIAGAHVAGAEGAASGLAAGGIVSAVLWWVVFWRKMATSIPLTAHVR